MSKALFVQRRDGRVAALQFLYAWSMNAPKNLAEDLGVFFESCAEPREHYAFGEELIQGVISHIAEINRSPAARRMHASISCVSNFVRPRVHALVSNSRGAAALAC